jgi:hypothetical protein
MSQTEQGFAGFFSISGAALCDSKTSLIGN